MDDCLIFEVDREHEFAPVKNSTGVDSVDTARALLEKNGYTLLIQRKKRVHISTIWTLFLILILNSNSRKSVPSNIHILNSEYTHNQHPVS